MGEADRKVKRLRSYFSPRSIAVVGANEGNGFVKNLVRSAGNLRFSFVNRRGVPVNGHPTVSSIEELPDGIDLAVLSVPADGVLPAVQQGVERGIRNFIVHSAGFVEAGPEGRARQEELVRFARDNDVCFVGPNCLGFANNVLDIPLHGATLPVPLVPGRVGMIAQSGSASIVLMNAACQFGFSYIVTTGNEAVCTSEDVLEFLIQDDATDIIMMFIEALRDGERFLKLARQALEAGKPIVALKVGRSSAGKQVAMSHTGAIAGADDVYEAALRSVGVIQVFNFDEMIQTTNLLSALGPALVTRPAVVGISGGELGLAADIAEDIGLQLPKLSEETRRQLAELMGLDPSKIANPLDLGNGFTPKTFKQTLEKAFTILEADETVGGLILLQDTQRSLQEGYRTLYRMVTDAFADYVTKSGRPAMHVSNLSEPHDPEIVAPFVKAGVPSLAGSQTALRVVQKCAAYAERRNAGKTHAEGGHAKDARAHLERFVAKRREATSIPYVPEYEALSLLAGLGMPAVEEVTAATADEAVAAAQKLGFPVVVKIRSDEVVHKAAAGGVIVGVTSAEGVVQAFKKITAAVDAANPGASRGVIVASQKNGAAELILGALEDPTFGTFIVFGIGGGLVEPLGRTSVFVLPRTIGEATAMIASSHAAPVLRHLGVEPEQLAPTVLCFAGIAEAGRGLFSELEINPVIVAKSGEHWAVDARMRLS